MSFAADPPEFNTVELLSLYATMVMKRIALSLVKNKGSFIESVDRLVTVVEYNINKMNFDKKWFFATLRDQARVHSSEWHYMMENLDMGEMAYNTTMLVVALRLDIEKIWYSPGNLPLLSDGITEYFSAISNKDGPRFALTYLNQPVTNPLFDYFAQHSPNLTCIQLPCDNETFKKCMVYRNLREIEFSGCVNDKVMCNALWNTGTKKSDKVLEMGLKGGGKNLTLNLPHLTKLVCSMYRTQVQTSIMRLSLGAAALVLQPEMETVQNDRTWDTFVAIVLVLDVQQNLGLQPVAVPAAASTSKDVTTVKGALARSQKSVQQIVCRPEGLAVKSLHLRYGGHLDVKCLKEVMNACPKLDSLELTGTKDIDVHLALMGKIIPMHQLTTLILDAHRLTGKELCVLLSTADKCKNVTLRVTPASLANFNLPAIPLPQLQQISESDWNMVMMFPHIESLTLDFSPEEDNDEDDDDEDDELFGHIHSQSKRMARTEAMLDFFSTFASVKELHLRKTVAQSPHFLVYGCIGGALSQIRSRFHLSIIAFAEDFPEEDPSVIWTDSPEGDCAKVQKMLSSLQDIWDMSIMKKLKSLELDCVYVNEGVDLLIKSLRVAGVLVNVLYRPSVPRDTLSKQPKEKMKTPKLKFSS